MKKQVLLISAFFYLLFSSGLIINSHYCMNQLSSMELFGSADDTCDKCGMSSSHGCCNDETRLIKLQDDHLTSYVSFDLRTFSPVVVSNAVNEETAGIILPRTTFHHYHPPPGDGVPIFIKNRVFRI